MTARETHAEKAVAARVKPTSIISNAKPSTMVVNALRSDVVWDRIALA
jgi:hypothetical protein